MSFEKLKKAIEELEKHARGVAIIGYGPDKFISDEEAKQMYAKVKEAFNQYEKERSDAALANLHDALMMLGKDIPIPSDAMKHVLDLFQDTESFKNLQERLREIDFSNLEIDEQDAYHLAGLSVGVTEPTFLEATKHVGMLDRFLFWGIPEYNGTMRIENNKIKLITSNIVTHEHSAIVSLRALLESDSHGWWHTHPFYVNVERPSTSDIKAVKQYKIPMLTAIMGRDGKPKVFITDPKGKTHEVKIKYRKP
ncbi:MAG: hypothetical protein J7K68_06155 [Candidatus Diapherotrites archaeon]|nr:hypothetical protein [Candidatus Diapherotrites archaeon]